ncbi:hypothetical protein [Corynebacterium ulceribovis]|uniref:hypothetical protein n=1 Tax=Corynebacterium ulceribovis TaxID=487732 RepID=UPI00036EB531|nr:hypothetical protein [Corynebacterium ulceribovis]
MPSMFPSMARRTEASPLGPRPTSTPQIVHIGFWLLTVTVVLTLVTGLNMVTTDVSGRATSVELADLVARNMKILGVTNLVLGTGIAAFLMSVRQGDRTARTVVLVLVMLLVLANMLGFLLRLGMFASLLIVVLSVVGTLLLFTGRARLWFQPED